MFMPFANSEQLFPDFANCLPSGTPLFSDLDTEDVTSVAAAFADLEDAVLPLLPRVDSMDVHWD
jgi:hypothetical protein